MHCGLYPVYNVHCTGQCAMCTVYCTVHCTLCIIHCTALWSLYPVCTALVTSEEEVGGSVSATSGSFEPRPKLPVWKTVGGKTRPEIYLSPENEYLPGKNKEF